MIVIDDDTVYKVWWDHRDATLDGSTICRIKSGRADFTLEQWDMESTVGQALLNPRDTYSRNKGRKVALARAIEALGCDYELRRKFWQAYREQLGHW